MHRRRIDAWYFEVGADPDEIGQDLGDKRVKLARGRHWEPKADVVEEESRVVVVIELAGVKASEIRLTIDPEVGEITIQGVRKPSQAMLGKPLAAFQLEIPYGEFERTIRLPEMVFSLEELQAVYRNGMLFIFVPKHSD